MMLGWGLYKANYSTNDQQLYLWLGSVSICPQPIIWGLSEYCWNMFIKSSAREGKVVILGILNSPHYQIKPSTSLTGNTFLLLKAHVSHVEYVAMCVGAPHAGHLFDCRARRGRICFQLTSMSLGTVLVPRSVRVWRVGRLVLPDAQYRCVQHVWPR